MYASVCLHAGTSGKDTLEGSRGGKERGYAPTAGQARPMAALHLMSSLLSVLVSPVGRPNCGLSIEKKKNSSTIGCAKGGSVN